MTKDFAAQIRERVATAATSKDNGQVKKLAQMIEGLSVSRRLRCIRTDTVVPIRYNGENSQ